MAAALTVLSPGSKFRRLRRTEKPMESMNDKRTAAPSAGQQSGASPVCPHCGSREVVKGVRLSLLAEVGSIGLNYKANVLFHGTEPLRADLCRGCGTVIRLHVEQPNRNWIQG